MGIKERLAVIEAKLGIEAPENGPVFVWDGDNRADGSFCDTRYRDMDDEDRTDLWDHFAYVTPELMAIINSLVEAKK